MSESITKVSKVVLITGCSSGIGQATARYLASRGHQVVATARKVKDLGELKAAGCDVLALDVNDEASMVAAVRTIEAKYGAIGVLVNNAGYSQSGAIETVPLAKVRAQFETNVFGLVRLTQLVLPGMRRQGWGRVINMSSMGGKLTFPGGGYYHATKHAVEAISDALRFEVQGFGIKVVLVEPGLIKSGFSEAAVGAMDGAESAEVYGVFHDAVAKATKESYEKGPLAKLAGVPEDVAEVIEKAIVSKSPRARYTVSGSAKLLLTQRKMMSDRTWDWFLKSNFPVPGVAAKA
ncbi:MAG: SDR family NAD(P)-dependent oxidoreductase [Archangium sp.]|nr:SDR family NAD(P)-dependent oxidoreductase [Archangium sp.]